MRFNWVNLLATLLILGGAGLLIERHFNAPPKHHIPTVEEAKADIQRQIETKLNRPLSPAEVEMIEVTKTGDQISITLHQPLTGRLMKAIHDAKAATQPSAQSNDTNFPGLPGGNPNRTELPTTIPSTVPPIPTTTP
jgi:hypothetical protein